MSTATLQIEKKKTLAPQLRFQEFNGEWELNKLGEVAQFKAGYAFKSQQMLSKKSTYQLLKMSNVYQNELRLDRNPSFWKTIDAKQKEFLLKKGDSILTLTGTVGKKDYGYSIQIEDDNKYLLNQRLVLLRAIQSKSDNGFINYLLSTEKFLFYFFAEAKGGTGNQTNVSTEDVKNIKLNIPTLPEQQKIASFLSAVDEKIQQLSRKKELLEQYKKGVMQQLFSGKLRFKDESGNDYADWEEKKLGDFCTFFSGGTPTSTNQKFYSGTIPFIGSGNIYDSEVFNFISEEALNSSSAKIVEKGDLLYALYGANSGELAISKMNGAINQAILCIRNEQCIEYLYYILLLNKDNIVAKYLQGGQGNLSAQIIKKLKYKFPLIPEQQKIANFLSSIDSKIESVNQQLAQTQTFKKSLLQQMFV